MRSTVSDHFRSNVVGYIALFCFAMAGTAGALPGKNKVDSGDIKNGQVKTEDVAASAVTGTQVADGSVGGADVNPAELQRRVTGTCVAGQAIRAVDSAGAVTCEPIATTGAPTGPAGGGLTGTYPNPTVAANAIGSAETIDNSLTFDDLAADSADSAEIATGAVGTSEVAINSLTFDDLAADSAGSAEIATGAVGTSEVAINSLTADDLAADSADSAEIATGAVGTSEVDDETLTADELAPNSVDVAEVASSAINSAEVNNNSLTGIDILETSLDFGILHAVANANCDPTSATAITCTSVDLPEVATEVLALATMEWYSADAGGSGGSCGFFLDGTVLTNSVVIVGENNTTTDSNHQAPLTLVFPLNTTVIGPNVLSIRCSESENDFKVENMELSVLQL